MTTQTFLRPQPMMVAPLADPSQERFALIAETLSVQSQIGSWGVACRHQALMQVTAFHNLPLQHMGFAPLPSKPRVFRGRQSDWVVMDVADDPVTQAYNELLVPPAAGERIEWIASAGVDFDRWVIVHEVPKETVGDDGIVPFALIAPPQSSASQERIRKIEQASDAFWRGAQSAASTAVKVAAGAAVVGGALAVGAVAVTAAASVAAAAALLSLDPILFGVLVEKGKPRNSEPMAAWYYLAHWRWSEV